MAAKPHRTVISDRSILCPADVSDEALASMVEDRIDADGVELLSCAA